MEETLKMILDELRGVKGEVAGIKEEVAGIKEEVAGIKEEVAGIKGEVSGIKTEIIEIKEEVAGIKGEVTGIKVRLDSLESGQKELYQLTSSIENLSRSTSASLKGLENRVGDQNEFIITSLSKNDQELYVIKKELARMNQA